MSDSTPNKASGCSIFFTLTVVLGLVIAFLIVQNFLQPEKPESATKMVDDTRLNKINVYEDENTLYSKQIVSFHEDNNSSIEATMENIVLEYQSNSKTKQSIDP